MDKKRSYELRRDFVRMHRDDVHVLEYIPDIPFPTKVPKLTRPSEYGQMLLNKRKRR
jgi:hypothetical protein